jgi:hypothetical protein
MKVLRIVVAVSLILCTVPIAVLAATWALSAVSDCPLQFKGPQVCFLGPLNIGWLLDILLQFGVLGALSFGAGVYVFAGWVLVEIGAIVLVSLRRG